MRNAKPTVFANQADARNGARVFRSSAALVRSAASPLAVLLTLGLAALAWFVSIRSMNGMDMGVATQLPPLGAFLGLWSAMIAAMMLPGTVPALVRSAGSRNRASGVLRFLGSYLGVWTLVGPVVYALYRPHGTLAAGTIVIAAGLYELTPFKRHCRRLCREPIRSGVTLGLFCLGSGAGLMLVQLALGIMSVPWMCAIAVVASAQKLLPTIAAIDVAVAFAIVGLGVLIIVAPALVNALPAPM